RAEAGLGGRVRWWSFSQATAQGVSVPASTPNTRIFLESAAPLGFAAFDDNENRPASLFVTSKLRFNVWDAEALADLQTGCWDLLLAGGARYAQISQHFNVSAAGDSGGGTGPIPAPVPSRHPFHPTRPLSPL